MSFPRYLKYKPSGVEWLGDVPEHWGVRPLRSLGAAFGGLRGKAAADFTDEGPHTAHYVPFTNILNNAVVSSAQLDPVQVEPGDAQNEVRPGDLLYLMSSEDYDCLGSSSVVQSIPPRTFLNSFCKGFRPSGADVDSAYLNYYCRSRYGRAVISQFGFGFTRINLRTGALLSTPVLTPPLQEQCAIAGFLDRETAKIDELVAEQQRLIALLKEKRRAVISHVVTKGLDPSNPMRPSGVEWLGKVPAHWGWGRLRFLSKMIVDGTHRSPESFQVGDRLYVTAKNVREEGVDLSEVTYVSADVHAEIFSRCPVQPGDVLYIKDGATAGIATVNRLSEPFSLLSSVAVIRPDPDLLDAQFLAHLLNASCFKQDALNRAIGGAMTRLTLDLISRFVVALPPLREQHAIAEFLDQEMTKIGGLVTEAESSISLLQERRSALISAAATGQIDVRGTVATEAA